MHNDAIINANGVGDGANAIKVPDDVDKMPDIPNKVPDSADEMPDTMEGLPHNEQEQYVLKNGSITTSKAAELLGVKHRRARAVLLA